MIYPRVHINGTSGEDLLQQYSDAETAIVGAVDRIPVPDERDYYVQDPGAFQAAHS